MNYYVVIMELRNSRLITVTDKKRNTKGVRDGKRRNALRSELRRKTPRTGRPLIILCPPYLTTFAGNTRASTPSIRINIVHNYIFVRVYVHTRANWARVITYPRRTMRWICVCHWVLYIFYCYGRERVISFFFVCSSNSMRGAHRCVMINSICDSCVISASNQLFEIMIW